MPLVCPGASFYGAPSLCSNMKLVFSSINVVLMVPVAQATTIPQRSLVPFGGCCAFAGGGFGAGNKKKKSSSAQGKKKNKRKSGLKEVIPLEPFVEPRHDDRVLDKWGLPPPTIEDIFPQMPPGTELIPATKEEYALQEIVQAMKQHIPLTLQETFGENCIEKNTALDERPPMKVRLLHVSPPVLAIDNFFTPQECLQVEHVAMPPQTKAAYDSASKDRNAPVQVDSKTFTLAQSTRTSTSWFCYYRSVPTLLSKARDRLGIPLSHMEEPQIVRYQTGQEFSWHYDEVPKPQLSNGGQRLATLLVYLNTVQHGGGTIFRDLYDRHGQPLCMQPTQGSALLFFPAYADGTPDDRTLHKGEVVAMDEKRIIQMWIHQRSYQAAVPPGNLQQAAVDLVNATSSSLGYISSSQ